MATELQKRFLRDAVRKRDLMARWRRQAQAQGQKDPVVWAKTRAMQALAFFDQTLQHASKRGEQPDLAQIADETLFLMCDAEEQQDRASNFATQRNRPARHVAAGTKRVRNRKATNSRNNKPVRKSKPKQRVEPKNTPEPYRRNYFSWDEQPKSRAGGNPRAAARVETPSYARFVNEGIGGTRDEAIGERNKLRRESKYRS